MSVAILSHDRENTNTAFDATMTVPTRMAGTITISPDYIAWVGDTMVRATIGGQHFHLRAHEARELAHALQSLSTHIDEEAASVVTRRTLPGAPAFEEAV